MGKLWRGLTWAGILLAGLLFAYLAIGSIITARVLTRVLTVSAVSRRCSSRMDRATVSCRSRSATAC